MNDINVALVREALNDARRWIDRQADWCADHHNKGRCDCPNGRGLLLSQLLRASQEFGMSP